MAAPWINRSRLGCAAWALFVACIPNLTLPAAQQITCSNDSECPVDLGCATSRSRCVSRALLCDNEAGPCALNGETGVCVSGLCEQAGCGNGSLELGETCDDGNTDSGDGCSADCLSSERCGNGIRDVNEGCDCGDTAFASGCTHLNSNDPAAACRADCRLPHCGDGVRAGLEQCDGATIEGPTCLDLGFYAPGGLACDQFCNFDVRACQGGRCGDGVINGGEDCDGADLGLSTCANFGFYGAGGLGCDAGCRFVTEGCKAGGYCGDGAKNGPEVCDGSWLDARTCVSFGYDAGAIACSASCTPLFSDCLTFGAQPHASVNTTWSYRSLWASSPTDVWATDPNTGIAHYDGSAWSAPTGASGIFANMVQGRASNDVYFATNAAIWHFDGTQFQAVTATPAGGLWVGPTTVLAINYSPNRVDRLAAGVWAPVGLSGVTGILTAVWGAADNDVWLVGQNGEIDHFDGNTITPTPSVTTASLTGIWGCGPRDIWAVGGGSVILHYDGAWRVYDPGDGASTLNAISGSGCRDIWATQSGTRRVLHYDGNTWTAVTQLSVASGIAASAPGQAWVSDRPGRMTFLSTAAWYVLPAAPSGPVNSVSATSGGALWAAAAGTMSSYNGLLWSAVPAANAVSTEVAHIFAAHAGHLVAATTPDPARVLQSDGVAWTLDAAGPSSGENFVPPWASGPRDIWIADANAYLWHFDGTWSMPATSWAGAETPLAFWGPDASETWAVGQLGLLSRRNASSWTDRRPAGLGLVSVESVSGTTANDVFAVTAGGHLLHHDGAAWTTRKIDTAMHTVWAGAPDDVWAAGDGNTILRYDGKTWTAVRGPFDFTVDLTQITGTPSHIFVRGSNGSVAQLARWRSFVCAAAEVSCGDGVDEDCDGRIDGEDSDCADVLRLNEVSTSPAFFEVVNRTQQTVHAEGLSLAWRFTCDTGVRTYRFGNEAFVPAGSRLRVLSSPIGLGARERPLYTNVCAGGSTSGWVALCGGDCNLATCDNVIDYVQIKGGSAIAAPPACASFVGPGVDVTANTTMSVNRVMFGGNRTSDWSLQNATQD